MIGTGPLGFPTVLKDRGYIAIMYHLDHDPAHVHVMRQSGRGPVAQFKLDDAATPICASRSWKESELRAMRRLVLATLPTLREEWKLIHGTLNL